jgi:hypothetical protein
VKFDAELFKKHPYATGGVVIVGGLAVFYLLSRSQGSSAVASSPAAADAQLASIQAGAAVQTNAQQAALQAAQINASAATHQTDVSASVSNTQTLAALAASLFGTRSATEVAQINADAATLQQANQETAQQNIAALQESGILSQVNAQAEELANNNATSLEALRDQLSAQGAIASQVISSATGLATQQQTDFEKNVTLLAPTFGKQYNSALDANNAAAEIETVLAGGNPGVAATGIYSSTSAVSSGNAASAAKVGSVTSGIASIVNGLFG